jgi:hypothetical protein
MTLRRPWTLLFLTLLTAAAAFATGYVGPREVKTLPEGFTRPILAVEFVRSAADFRSIVDQPALEPPGSWVSYLVYRSTVADLGFIAAYGMLWFALLLRIETAASVVMRLTAYLGRAAIVIAVIADGIEDAGILHSLHAAPTPELIRYAALTKWAALGVVFLALAAGFTTWPPKFNSRDWRLTALPGFAYLASGIVVLAGVSVGPHWLEYLIWPSSLALLLQIPVLIRAIRHPVAATGSPDFTEHLDDVRERELDYITRRRASGAELPECKVVSNTLVGLSLSGGGIRSATTNLGILQALSKMGILPKVDYLSTVSGGGYIGSALMALLSIKQGTEPGAAEQYTYGSRESLKFSTDWRRFPFNPELDPTTGDCCAPQSASTPTKDIVSHLRTHGNFLIARRGLLKRDALRAVGHLLTGTVYHLLTTTVILFLTAVLLMGLAHGIEPDLRLQLAPETAQETTTLAAVTPTSAGLGYSVTHLEEMSFSQAASDRFSRMWESVKWDVGHTGLLKAAGVGAMATLVVFVFLFLSTRQTRWPKSWGAGENKEDRFARFVLNTSAALLGLSLLIVWGFVERTDHDGHAGWIVQPFLVMAGARVTTFLLYVLIAKFNFPSIPFWNFWSREFRSLWGAFQTIATYGMALTLAFAALPILAYAAEQASLWAAAAPVVSLVLSRVLVSGAAQGASDKLRIPKGLLHFVLAIAVTVVIAFSVVGFAAMAAHYKFDGMTGHCPDPWAIAAGSGLLALAALSVFGDINKISPHYFYRDRLLETYLRTERPTASKSMETFTDAGNMRLSELQGEDPTATPGLGNTAPYMLISAAINLSGSRDLTRKDRKSGYFLFSKYYCGSRQTGYRKTDTWRDGETKLSRAVTISGAAVSSAMGSNTFFAEALVTSVFNLRLGYWMSNPRTNPKDRWVFWPRYMFQEVFATTNERRPLVNLSDGGHTGDNVGIYPLLERRCQVIIACDAEADAGLSFGSFTEALRHAYVDLGVDVDIDLSLIRPDPETGLSKSHCAVGRIRYPECPDRPNWIVYLKSSMTGDEPATVLNYKATAPVFPHESTADQFFDDAQFESYRALGVHMAEETFGWWAGQREFIDALNRPDVG